MTTDPDYARSRTKRGRKGKCANCGRTTKNRTVCIKCICPTCGHVEAMCYCGTGIPFNDEQRRADAKTTTTCD